MQEWWTTFSAKNPLALQEMKTNEDHISKKQLNLVFISIFFREKHKMFCTSAFEIKIEEQIILMSKSMKQ